MPRANDEGPTNAEGLTIWEQLFVIHYLEVGSSPKAEAEIGLDKVQPGIGTAIYKREHVRAAIRRRKEAMTAVVSAERLIENPTYGTRWLVERWINMACDKNIHPKVKNDALANIAKVLGAFKVDIGEKGNINIIFGEGFVELAPRPSAIAVTATSTEQPTGMLE